MKLLRLAIETQRWELAAHVLIVGAITAKQREMDGEKKKCPQPKSKKR